MSVVKSLRLSRLSLLVLLTVLGQVSPGQEQKADEPTKLPKPLLTAVETVNRADLSGVNSGTVSADGRFLYTSAWRHNSLNVFSRDQKTGRLTHVQTLTSERDLAGATCVRLSADGKYAIASAFQSKTLVLLHVDAESGKLRIADVAREDENGVIGLSWAISAEFSPDSRFVYGSDDSGSMTVFQVTGSGKLRFVESNLGEDTCFAGVRWATVHPDLDYVYSTCTNGTVVASKRNTQTGKLSVKQIFHDDTDGIMGLQGAMTSALSPDGKFLYVSSGRFSGDTAIGVYAVRRSGLRFVHELHEDNGDFKNFLGSNAIMVSPDGKCVFAAGTRSQSFVCLQRNPRNGRVAYLETISDDSDEEGDNEEEAAAEDEGAIEDDLADDLFNVGAVAANASGAAGIAISPDSKFVYVMVEDAGKIRVFARNDLVKQAGAKVAEESAAN